MSKNVLRVAQQRSGGYVLRYGGVTSGGMTFIAALRDLYKRVPAKYKPTVEKIGKDAKVKGFIDGLHK